MKTIYETGFGGDGGKVGLYLEDGNIVQKASYPVEKALGPVNSAIDSAVAKIESLIPGDWDKAILEPLAAGLKAEIAALLSGG